MTIGIIGGTGFLGKEFARHVLEHSSWQVVVITHSDKQFDVAPDHAGRLQFRRADVLNEAALHAALHGVDVAYYFVHMMGQKDVDFYEAELKAAYSASAALANTTVKRLIYMGGLGNERDNLSDHLLSRQRTGGIFRAMPLEVIELRASMIIGDGSVAFDIIRNLADKLPIMPLPRSAATQTQPIALADALAYLYAAAALPIQQNIIVEIGGPEILSYADVYRKYVAHTGKKTRVIEVPFLSPRLEAVFLDFFTPKVHARIGQAMIESLENEMIVTDTSAKQHFPDISPRPIIAAF